MPDCPDIDAQAIANSFFALGLLVTQGRTSSEGFLAFSFSPLLEQFFNLPQLAMHSQQILQGSTAFLEQGFPSRHALTLSQLEALMERTLQGSYLHPNYAAKLIHTLRLFKYSSPRLDKAFEYLWDALNINYLSEHLQTQLDEDLDTLASISAWKQILQHYVNPRPPVMETQLPQDLEPLIPTPEPEIEPTHPRQRSSRPENERSPAPQASRPRPQNSRAARAALPSRSVPRQISATTHSGPSVPPEIWNTARQNPIFNAIATDNFRELCRILGVDHLSSAQGRTTAPSRRQSTRGTQRRTGEAAVEMGLQAQTVIDFLTTTHAQALRLLISQSRAKYFEILLEALSHHQCYQLAKQENHPFYPILLYLPLEELKNWIKPLISPYQLYRDHRALLAVLDALTLRFNQKSREQGELFLLQTELINRGTSGGA